MNYQGAESYRLVPTSQQPHIKNRVLRVRFADNRPVYPRPKSKRSTRHLAKRSTSSNNGQCWYVKSSCVDAPLCGVAPLYNLMDQVRKKNNAKHAAISP